MRARVLRICAAEMATGGYSSSSASSCCDNISDDNCSEASSLYTSSSSDEEFDDSTGCKTFTLVRRRDRREVGIYYTMYLLILCTVATRNPLLNFNFTCKDCM